MAGAAPWIDFTGKAAMVTGAGNGMGLAIAKRLAGAGCAKIIMLDRDEEGLKQGAAEIGEIATIVPCDLLDLPATRASLEALGCIDTVDFLVNCAGVAIFQEFHEATPEVWDITMNVNVKAMVFLSQMLAKGMASRGGGAIVNISSQSSTVVVSEKHLAYSTSKAAVDHATRITAICLAKDKTRVNAVNPTVVRTELAIRAHGEEGLKAMAAKVPLGKICECDDVADSVLFLLSSRASMITGVTLPVDGGFIVNRQ